MRGQQISADPSIISRANQSSPIDYKSALPGLPSKIDVFPEAERQDEQQQQQHIGKGRAQPVESSWLAGAETQLSLLTEAVSDVGRDQRIRAVNDDPRASEEVAGNLGRKSRLRCATTQDAGSAAP